MSCKLEMHGTQGYKIVFPISWQSPLSLDGVQVSLPLVHVLSKPYTPCYTALSCTVVRNVELLI